MIAKRYERAIIAHRELQLTMYVTKPFKKIIRLWWLKIVMRYWGIRFKMTKAH
jgi:hypothetical protein